MDRQTVDHAERPRVTSRRQHRAGSTWRRSRDAETHAGGGGATSSSGGESEPPRRERRWYPNWILIVIALCITVAAVTFLLVRSPSNGGGTKPAGPTATTVAGSVTLQAYLRDLAKWADCVKAHASDSSTATSSPCGPIPKQPDSPAVNAYLADVLNWNKCAAPLLKRGARAAAVAACGPEPTAPSAG